MLLMSTVVLDAWAALAFLQRQGDAWVVVRRLLRRAVRGNVRLLMNVVNLGEVYYRLVQIAGQQRADERFQRFRRLPIEVLPVREALALKAARVKAAPQSRMPMRLRSLPPKLQAPAWQQATRRSWVYPEQ